MVKICFAKNVCILQTIPIRQILHTGSFSAFIWIVNFKDGKMQHSCFYIRRSDGNKWEKFSYKSKVLNNNVHGYRNISPNLPINKCLSMHAQVNWALQRRLTVQMVEQRKEKSTSAGRQQRSSDTLHCSLPSRLCLTSSARYPLKRRSSDQSLQVKMVKMGGGMFSIVDCVVVAAISSSPAGIFKSFVGLIVSFLLFSRHKMFSDHMIAFVPSGVCSADLAFIICRLLWYEFIFNSGYHVRHQNLTEITVSCV